ncbi:ATP-binding protein [Kutzneria buriramensis]|uniref:Uncharacterized protein n=1 Tax=Kutzneria buriramensis TaxID=1045776 RepID=A0A3E0HTK2_9PSEU|nr:ATP-binding protein [Kutzneria buriramensis]REH49764.1 hypothetical protein BCF44_10427 [Kutzneria buriramensis]
MSDPEHLGFALHRMLPPALRGDFQDLAAWRRGVREMLDLALRSHDGPVIVPMTLVEAGYFTDIVGRLRDDGHEVHHFALLAEPTTVLRRLNGRGLRPGLKHGSWAVARLDDCLTRLGDAAFATHIATDDRTVAQVAEPSPARSGCRSLRTPMARCARDCAGTPPAFGTSGRIDDRGRCRRSKRPNYHAG